MGFFGTLKKIIEGKPVFDAVDQSKLASHSVETAQATTTSNSSKILPVVRIERTECHDSGAQMTVRCTIRNDSDQEIELDKIRLIGMVRELDTRLRPHESRELVVYSGNRPNNRSYTTAELNYKDMSGDYFQARYVVEFRQESDNTYSIARINLTGSIKDIQ